jgi:methyl-accepting chemotaxis protein
MNQESRNFASVTVASAMASALENGILGRRREMLELARQILEKDPRHFGAYIGLEPNADGQDAAFVRREQSTVPAQAMDDHGRFMPYWFHDPAQNDKIALKPLDKFEDPWYQVPLRNWRDHGTRTAVLTEPYMDDGVLMTECSVPVIVDGKFVGVVGVDRALSRIETYLQTLATHSGNNVFLISAGGKFIGAASPVDAAGKPTADLSNLKSRDVAATAWGAAWGPMLAAAAWGEGATTAWLEDPAAKSETVFAAARVPTGGWTVVVEVPASRIHDTIFNFAIVSALIGLLAIGIATVLLIRLAAKLARRIRVAAEAASVVAQGDLSHTYADPSNRDESGQLLEAMDVMGQRLAGLIGKVREATITITGTANEMTAASRQQDEVAQSFGASSNEIAAAIRQISSTSAELFRTMEVVSGSATESSRLANEGRSDLQAMESTMDALAKATGEISSRLAAINDKATSINAIVVAITKVADQTNLLSVNAAIEAEKAGESGKGFLVVAREIRRLADQTASATLDIERTVEQMQTAVSGGVMEMDRFADQVRRGVGQVNSIGQRLSGVIQGVSEIGGQFGEVTTGMQSQVQGAEQIRLSMDGLSQNASRARDATREFAEAAQSLTQSIAVLREAVSLFRLADQARRDKG